MTAVDEVEEELPPLPAIFEHACNVYKEMESEAVLHKSEQTDDGGFGQSYLVWEGHLTKLFARLHLSVPYYTSVTRELKRMGCIRQLRRGGGNAASQWLIMTAPTEELFRDERTVTTHQSTRKKTALAIMEQRVNDMARRLLKVESDNELIIQILHEKEQASA